MTGNDAPVDAKGTPGHVVGHYDANYANFASNLYQEIRSEAFGEDLGQNSWLTTPELLKFAEWLQLKPGGQLLDIACGSGGPVLRMAKLTQIRVTGIDLHGQAIANAIALARTQGLAEQARFECHDASKPLPFPAAAFDALICIDAVNHLPQRRQVFSEWARVLKPGGRLVFTDPIVITGPLTHEEIAVRSSAGFYLFVPPGEDERLLRAAGLNLLLVEDLTEQVAEVARRRGEIEGDATFERQQEFLRVAASIASEHRLSRLAFLAATPA